MWFVASAFAAPVLGDLVLDPARWRVSLEDGAAIVVPAEGGTPTRIRAVPSGATCTLDVGGVASTADHDGLAVRVSVRDLGCRNLVPRTVWACVALRGREYEVRSTGVGCDRGPGDDETMRVLAELRAAP